MREWLNAKVMGNEDKPAGCRHCPAGERRRPADAGDQYAIHNPGKGQTSTTTHKSTVAAKPKPLVLVTEKDKQSYAIGLNVGKSLHRDSIDVEPEFVLQGLEDALADGKVLLTDDQIKTVMTDLQNQVRQKQEEKRLAVVETNKKEGAAFLAANATKEGVVTLPERPAIQSHGCRNGSQAYRCRFGRLQLPGNAARQYGI